MENLHNREQKGGKRRHKPIIQEAVSTLATRGKAKNCTCHGNKVIKWVSQSKAQQLGANWISHSVRTLERRQTGNRNLTKSFWTTQKCSVKAGKWVILKLNSLLMPPETWHHWFNSLRVTMLWERPPVNWRLFHFKACACKVFISSKRDNLLKIYD